MITQGVITASLIGIVITGLVPIIGGIVLMAMGKIKASSFWAGVLAYIIALITASIVVLIIGFAAPDMVANNQTVYGIISSVIMGVMYSLAMGVCIKSCMKLRTFNAALSCGFGLGAGYAVTIAVGLIGSYITFGSINSGAFDRQYTQYVEMGIISKDDFNLLKETYTSFTVMTIVQEILTAVFLAAALAAAAVFIMRFVCAGKASLGILSAIGTITLYSIGSALPNAVAAIIVAAAIGIAALVFALRMKDQVVPPEKKTAADPFMNSVENAKNEE